MPDLRGCGLSEVATPRRRIVDRLPLTPAVHPPSAPPVAATLDSCHRANCGLDPKTILAKRDRNRREYMKRATLAQYCNAEMAHFRPA